MRRRPLLFHTALAMLLAGLTTLGLGWAVGASSWLAWLACGLAAVNAVAFAYYGFDKRRARAGASRVPEAVLHLLAAAGGSLGAFAGMRLFRHKTVKGRFQVGFWVIVVVQAALLAWVGYRLWRNG